MRLLLIHNRYGKESGEERMLGRIAKLLEGRGHQVICRFVAGIHPRANWYAQSKAFFSGIYSPGSVREARLWVQAFRPDIVQVQNLYPWLSPWILPAIRQEGSPIVMRCANYRLICPSGLMLSHDQVCERCVGGKEYWCLFRNCENCLPKSFGYALRNFVARTQRLYLDNVTLYYAQTEFQKKKLIEGGLPAARIEVIPNMVAGFKATEGTPIGEYVGFAGRGSLEKGVMILLQVARMLPDIPFRLAGDFERIPEVEGKKSNNVELLGHLQGQALDDFYRKCRFLVLPSTWYEGFPGVVLEAMIQGKPVVCSKIGGLPEIVDDGVNGLLFDPGNPEDLAAKIERLWNRQDQCSDMGRAGRAKALQEYSPERYYEALMHVYRRASILSETLK